MKLALQEISREQREEMDGRECLRGEEEKWGIKEWGRERSRKGWKDK